MLAGPNCPGARRYPLKAEKSVSGPTIYRDASDGDFFPSCYCGQRSAESRRRTTAASCFEEEKMTETRIPDAERASVIRRDGVRGAVFYVKFVDAAGRQVKERIGREADGWNERKARAELEARLTDVRREGLRKPKALTFAALPTSGSRPTRTPRA
jgi:hypothetical protein